MAAGDDEGSYRLVNLLFTGLWSAVHPNDKIVRVQANKTTIELLNCFYNGVGNR